MAAKGGNGALPPGSRGSSGQAWAKRFGDALFGFLRSPKALGVLIPIVGILIGIKVLSLLCIVSIGPNEFGIKVVRVPIFGARGVHEEVYDTGFHFVFRPFSIEQMFRFPKDIQVLDFTDSRREASRAAQLRRPAHIQTSDGFFVDVDATILYRIANPYVVFTRLGAGRLFESNGIIPKAEPILKQTLGELTTEEFYNSPLRHEKAELARKLLNEELEPYGLHIDHVLVRYFVYSNEIQKNIEEKKLKDQLVFKNQAEGRAAKEEAILKKTIQEGEAAFAVKLEEGRAYVVKKNAEKDLYARKKHADADLLVKLAEAKKTELRNEALQGRGSSRMVGLKMAEVFEGIEILVLPTDGPNPTNPLDLEQTLRLLDVDE